jgi:hypothetical protein
MKRFKNLAAALVLSALASSAVAASHPSSNTNDDDAHAVGIITPNVATSAVVFDYFIRFRDTGEFAICSDGTDHPSCDTKKYLTPEQFVAKFYPKAKYVGFRLMMSSTSGSDTYLYIYLKKAPQ